MSTDSAPSPIFQGSRSFEYAVVDVFAERTLEGNMLAVFLDARGLSDAEMQALARETNLSETTFIFPADDPESEQRDGVRVRIFTTQEELPFAGHPTLGTASCLWYLHPTLRGAEEITLRLNVGPIPVRFDPTAADRIGVFATMRQRDPEFGTVHEPEAVARALGVPLDDLDRRYPPQTVSTGTGFVIVMLRSIAALEKLQIPQSESKPYLAASRTRFFYVLAPADEEMQTPGGANFRARMQFYSGEDPATGSACGCAISWLVRNGLVASGAEVVLEQGIEMKRPSRLYARATLSDGSVHDVFVGGRTIPVAMGRLFLP
jgi:trans-2,3-dihydro-3-hydroxyanthranilate isomerase